MKNKLGYLLMIFCLAACNNDTKQKENSDTVSTITNKSKPAIIADVPWAAIIDSTTQKITMTQSVDVDPADLDTHNVTEALNRKYQEIKISNTLLKNDTVFLNIDNATYLTQNMGTMGAEIFLADVTYSFTEINGINYVNFSFKEGDHASPGTYKRSNFTFKNRSLINE